MKFRKIKKTFSKMRIKIALRNIIRHRLRSILSIGMIAGAVCAIILFHGLEDFILQAVKHISAETQFGNMQIARLKYWNPGKEIKRERLFNLSEIQDLKKLNPEIKNISGRISFFGLVSNGDLSIGGKIIGIDPVGEPNFKNAVRNMGGKFFTDNNAKEAMIGKLMAKQMNLNPGDNITVLANTVDGVMNAMDLTVSGIYSAGIDEIDSQVIYTPLATAQAMLDTNDVDIAVIKFNKLEIAEKTTENINQYFKTINYPLKAKSWRELAMFYRQLEKFYAVQNKVIEAILLTLMFLGILNAVSMSVVERTGEIGTLRSFGEKRSDIIGQFILESLILTIIGTILGTFISYLLIQILEAVKIVTEMPGASVPFTLHINFLWKASFYASSMAILTSLIATYLPAKRAAKLDIVEALRKNV